MASVDINRLLGVNANHNNWQEIYSSKPKVSHCQLKIEHWHIRILQKYREEIKDLHHEFFMSFIHITINMKSEMTIWITKISTF